MKIVFVLALIAVLSFVIGGVNGSILTARLVYKKNIRDYGSGNPGLTNFHRSFGDKAIILVLLTDILKAVIPVVISGYIIRDMGDWGTPEQRVLFGRLYAGFFAMVGHCFPALHKLMGGKAVLTGGAVVVLADWRVAIIVLAVFFVTVALTHYVSLGSVLASAAYPIGIYAVGHREFWAVGIALMSGLLIIYRHKENIVRLAKGQERKFSFKRDKDGGH